MKKPNKKDTLNLIFSAFLMLGFIVCSYFFLTMTTAKPELAPYINTMVFVVFGLIIFYATRVGEGKAVKRFSLWTLIILDIPALYAVIAHFVEELPLHDQIAYLDNSAALPYSPLFIMACVVLGYGIPYTFLSGYEMAAEEEIFFEMDEDEDLSDIFGEDEDEYDGEYVLADENTEGAMLVVDDLDTAFNAETDIRLSAVVPCNDEVKVGSYVIYKEAETTEEYTEETETE